MKEEIVVLQNLPGCPYKNHTNLRHDGRFWVEIPTDNLVKVKRSNN
jgi:hypothetical protein